VQDKASTLSPSLKPAVGYLRRSTDRQDQSLPDQQAALERYAQANGFEILRFYTDDAISGTSAENRAQFQQLIADATNGHADFRHVLCYDVKRFSRGDNDEAGHYRWLLKKKNIDIVYATENFSGDDTDDLLRPVKQWQARQESKDLSKVTLRGQLSSIESGSYLGGVPPYGYDFLYLDSRGNPIQRVRFNEKGEKEIFSPDGKKLLRVVPQGERLTSSKQDRLRLVPSTDDRVAIIGRIFQEYPQGLGYRTIASRLNQEGVPAPRTSGWGVQFKGTWGLSTIRNIICNQTYVGDTVWNRRTEGKFHRVSKGRAVERRRHHVRQTEPNPSEDWIIIPNTHKPLVTRAVFEQAQKLRRKRDEDGPHCKHPRGRGKYSNYLLSGLITCGDCGHKFQGYAQKYRSPERRAREGRASFYLCGGYITKGKSVCKRKAYPRDPLEDYILGRVQARLTVFLEEGGDKILRQYIAEEIARSAIDPKEELKRVRSELAGLKKDADRLLDNLTESNRDFVDEKLVGIRRRLRELEAREHELATVADGPLDVEAVTAQALAHLAKFREVLDHGSILQRKEFLRGLVAGITLYPSENRGTVTFYDLIPASFKCRAGTPDVLEKMPWWRREERFRAEDEGWSKAA
jgi:site-specific DNA recombinase